MEMTERQKRLYNLGEEYAKRYDYIKDAFWAMDTDTLEDISMSRDYRFFKAGFYGTVPEWVRAIRFGEIPANGYSINHADGTREEGVSCVKIIRSQDDLDYKSIYDVTLGWQGLEKIIIEGWYFGDSGSDGEPLLIGAVKVND